MADTSGGANWMARPATLANMVPGLARVPGLHVDGNVLRGTLIMFFDGEAGVTYDKAHLVHLLRLVNRRMSNGYGIGLNIREATVLESIYTSLGWVNVYVLRTLTGTKCDGAAACYDPEWNTIRVTPGAADIYVVHELLHKLGLGHSGAPNSLMFPNQGARPSRDLKTYAEEIKRLVEAYR